MRKLKKLLLKEILLSKKVFIIGHDYIDLDAYGSMVGMSLFAKRLRTKSYLIINDKIVDNSIKEAIKITKKNVNRINLKQAKEMIGRNDILIVLDTNKEILISCKEELNQFKKVIVIDHHHENEKSIKTDYKFIDTKLSSTCEIITELLKSTSIKINKNVANVLLGGIILDTNNFSYRMNKKTFYYCYYLLSKGGNMDEAQSLLKQDLEKFVKRQRMFANIKQYSDTVITNGGTKIFRKEDLAKTADLLLQFKGIKNTFVIGKISETEYGISARTIGKMNINNMMEKMGGGGNEHEAATIIKDKTFEQIEKKLLKLIK